jgi:hypothetical protein
VNCKFIKSGARKELAIMNSLYLKGSIVVTEVTEVQKVHFRCIPSGFASFTGRDVNLLQS